MSQDNKNTIAPIESRTGLYWRNGILRVRAGNGWSVNISMRGEVVSKPFQEAPGDVEWVKDNRLPGTVQRIEVIAAVTAHDEVETTIKPVGMVPELGMGYEGWRESTSFEHWFNNSAYPYTVGTDGKDCARAAWHAAQRVGEGFEGGQARRTLGEIVAAIRTNQYVTHYEATYAVVAFDVLMSQLKVERDYPQLMEFFKAYETAPIDYMGPANDPANPEAVEWYNAMQKVTEEGRKS